ncbi:ferrous iron transport protein B [Thermospira aquatica]|uniref:Ferrous iron transport protein B n=1 Tax=Thermospira aquatica TaxID=2828656 RepID=A0AAX3BEV3_9SPIR|nr:ferrous iron transport protein B [Thermospira aquatica]URA10874.1 ferrous iron transport protein B [Thermospira aquatica]
MTQTLDKLEAGKRFRVKQILGEGKGLHRIRELGFSTIQEGVVVRNARGPILVSIQDRQIAIGRGIAARIEVEVLRDILYNELALIGQPNCGKTLLFNRLTGSSQHVGNWPGVTVEKKEGKTIIGGLPLSVIDLPGIYSFSSLSEEEEVAKSFVLSAKQTLFLNILDATHLEANLYLTVQLALMRVPMIVVVNMMDEAEKEGLSLDLSRLSELLGVPVIGISALKGEDIARLKQLIAEVLDQKIEISLRLSQNEVTKTLEKIAEIFAANGIEPSFWAAYAYLETNNLPKEIEDLSGLPPLRESFVQKVKKDMPTVMTEWILSLCMGIAREVVKHRILSLQTKKRITNALDAIFLNPIVGPILFFLFMGSIFWITFQLGDILSGYLESFFGFLAEKAQTIPIPWLASFISDGLIGGVGNVVALFPYIVIIFLLLSFLEDSGYMARGTFLVDRFMHKIGLHGKSFVPLVLGFGCSVPAIMSTRMLDNRSDKIKTMLMVPFFSCSARMPVFTLFAAAFFGKNGWMMLLALYVLGVFVAIFTAWWLSKSLIKEHSEGLIMELPVYRMPSPLNLWNNTWNRSKEYLIRAGSILLFFSIVLWLLSILPWGVEPGSSDSLIGRIGHGISWIFSPLGFDWQMTVALVNGFFAKEIVISTLGVLYGSGESLAAVLPQHMSLPTMLAYMVFILLYIPCAATVATLRVESRSWKWTLFAIVYGLLVAWGLAFVIKIVSTLILG